MVNEQQFTYLVKSKLVKEEVSYRMFVNFNSFLKGSGSKKLS